MAIRTFIFCDICNSMGIRTPEMRQGTHRDPERRGRRVTDSRAWFEGEITEAIAAGWLIDSEGRHVCPGCQRSHQELS
jgi:hypothetical protein